MRCAALAASQDVSPVTCNVQTCEAFSANRYPFPEEASRQRQMHGDVSGRLRELASTIDAGTRRRDAVLENLARSLQVRHSCCGLLCIFSCVLLLVRF